MCMWVLKWLFLFERYNGILGSYTNVNKNLEEQPMVKFLSISHSAALCSTTSQVDAELDFTMYLNLDMDIEKTLIVTSVFLLAANKPVNSINWRQCQLLQEIELPPKL